MNDLGIDLNRSRFFELKEKRKVIRKFRKRLLRRHYIYIYIYIKYICILDIIFKEISF